MINYPYLKLLKTYINSKNKTKFGFLEASKLKFKAGIFDCDFRMEVNSGRYNVLADMGRYNHGFITGWAEKAKKHSFYPIIAGIATKYRHRIPYRSEFLVETQFIYFDERWAYCLTNFILNDKISSILLAKIAMAKNGKLLSKEQIEEYLEFNLDIDDVPDIVQKWKNLDQTYVGL